MVLELGSGPQKVLEYADKAFQSVIYEVGKPILDSEETLQSFISSEISRKFAKFKHNSGWFTFKDSPVNAEQGLRGNLDHQQILMRICLK
jgi:hypothetical protein